MGKYSPLQEYLKSLEPDEDEIQLSFRLIEKIIQDKLPPASYKHRPWWANEKNGPHVQARAWMNAGWKVDSVDQGRETVTFVRAVKSIRMEEPSLTQMTLHEAMKDILASEPHEITTIEKYSGGDCSPGFI